MSRIVGYSFKECVHDVQMMCKVNVEEILALFVAFWEAVRPKRRTKFGRMQVIKCANV